MKLRKQISDRLLADAKRLEEQALQSATKNGISDINAYYDAQAAAIKEKYAGLNDMTEAEQQAFNALIAKNDKDRADAIKKYRDDSAAEFARKKKEMLDDILAGLDEGSAEWFAMRRLQLQQQFDEEMRIAEGNLSKRIAIEKRYKNEIQKLDEDQMKAKIWINQETQDQIYDIMAKSQQAMAIFGEESAQASAAAKALSLGMIAVKQGEALASGIASAATLKFPANIPAMLSIIATIMGMFAQVHQIAEGGQNRYATGGYVRGAGTGTSDSIPARLSNGESVVNANSTGMFSPLLSSLNMLGGGVPIQATASTESVQGEEMLARAFMRGASALPAPVVAVTEIAKASDRVARIKQMAKI